MAARLLLILITSFFYSLYSHAFSAYEMSQSYECSKMFPRFEKKFAIPLDTLHSIALRESGRKHKEHKIVVVWPWTVNVEGQGYYFHSKSEAIAFVRKEIVKGKESIDVGCMQINLKHHLKAFDSLEQAFDPSKNVGYGAEFLRSKYDQLGSWYKAIAHYHSATDILGSKYKEAVIKIANNMDVYKDSLRDYREKNFYSADVPGFSSKNITMRNNQTRNNQKLRKSFVANKKYKSAIMVRIPN